MLWRELSKISCTKTVQLMHQNGADIGEVIFENLSGRHTREVVEN